VIHVFALCVDGVAGWQRTQTFDALLSQGHDKFGEVGDLGHDPMPGEGQHGVRRAGLTDKKRTLKAYPRQHDRKRVPRPEGNSGRAVAIRGFDADEFFRFEALAGGDLVFERHGDYGVKVTERAMENG
jgi:hypothetical protein